jgi:hypothetical protein
VHIEEDHVGRSPYQSEKRRKEIARLKKQEEKRQRRFNKKSETDSPDGQPFDAIPVVEFGPDGLPVEKTPTDAATEDSLRPDALPEQKGADQPS